MQYDRLGPATQSTPPHRRNFVLGRGSLPPALQSLIHLWCVWIFPQVLRPALQLPRKGRTQSQLQRSVCTHLCQWAADKTSRAKPLLFIGARGVQRGRKPLPFCRNLAVAKTSLAIGSHPHKCLPEPAMIRLFLVSPMLSPPPHKIAFLHVCKVHSEYFMERRLLNACEIRIHKAPYRCSQCNGVRSL